MSQGSRIPVKKLRKAGRPNCEDYISNLPDNVISHILSCLPIEDAVRTCVLSKEWEYKWTFIYNMYIDDHMAFSADRSVETTFPDFMDRILLHSHNVKKFHLECYGKYKLSRITSWLCAVLRRNVESFEVDIPFLDDVLLLPRSLLNNTSLRSLKLHLPSAFRVPSTNCFPNLTSLFLWEVEIQSELSNTGKLVFSFPVLKTCRLYRCKWLNVRFVEIHAPMLTTFMSETSNDTRVDDYSMKIFGDRLQSFSSFGDLPRNFILTGSAVKTANLNNNEKILDLQLLGKRGLQVRKLLKALSSVKYLLLSGCTAEALAASKQGLPLPIFNKLERLSLCSHVYTEAEAILELLHAAPSLKYLDIDVNFLNDYKYDEVESVPSCIAHLQEVYFEIWESETPMFPLAKFLLKYAVKLEKFGIRGFSDDEGSSDDEGFSDDEDLSRDTTKSEIMQRLASFPKASTCLTIFATSGHWGFIS